MENKTAVEWFAERILSDEIFNFENVLKKAKEMHKKQIENAFVAGDERGTKEIPFNAEQYYSQTFKNK